MKQILMTISMLLLQGVAMAQGKISGVVVDDSDASPLIGATVVLLDEEMNQHVGVTTDADGRFELGGITMGDYLLQCSYVGYDAFTIVLKRLAKPTDLGIIGLKPSSAMLEEVVIEGERVARKVDRQVVMPTDMQRKAATNGVSLLQHLQLSGLSVDLINKSIRTNYGEAVQLRINGVEATQAEVVAIRPADVIRVEYHDQPGLRYGSVAAVVNYIVRRKETGGNLSADLTNGISLLGFGNYQVSGKYYQGKSVFSGLMQWSRRDLEWNRENEETFCYPERTITNREVMASPVQVKYDYLDWSLNYAYTNDKKSLLNIAFRNSTKDIPASFTDRNSILYQEDKEFRVVDREQSKSTIPSLDIYYQLNLKNDRHLYLDLVGTYLNSSSRRTFSMTEQGQTPVEVLSQTEGDKYSLIGEAIYELPLWSGKLSTGLKHNRAWMDNVYDGDIQSKVTMNTAETSLFAEYQAKAGKLNYILGLGAVRTFYRQGGESQEKYLFRPTLSLAYQPVKQFSLRYNATLSGYAPSLSALSDVEQSMDAYQVRRGNPGLQSVTYFSNRLSAAWRGKWLNLELSARYSYDHRPIMEETHYEAGTFIRTYANQKGFHRLNLQSQIQLRPFKNYLSISLNPYLNRYISRGNAYTHTHSNWGFRGSIVGMYKHWVFAANMNTSYHELWGETIKQGEAVHTVAVGYNREKWSIQAMVMNPFSDSYKQGVENVSRLAPNRQKAFSQDFSQVFMLNISFNLDFGKQRQIVGNRIRNSDTDTGILSGSK